MKTENIVIRNLSLEDIPSIVDAFLKSNWTEKPESLFRQYVAEQQASKREVRLAFVDDKFAGYVTLQWESSYQSFKDEGIPEIVDLNVLPDMRKKGIGTVLLRCAEQLAWKKSDVVGLGVGLYAGKDGGYGYAQQLYIKLGYIPDGRGVTYNYQPAVPGDTYHVDDNLTLWLTHRKENTFSKKELLKRLEAVYTAFLAIKVLFETNIPEQDYAYNNRYFQYMSIETKKLICGRLYVLICDKKSKGDNNTISLKILVDNIKDSKNDYITKWEANFIKISSEIKNLSKDERLKAFRDKAFAHTDLNTNNDLIPLSYFGISNQSISDMFDLASRGLESIRLYLSDTTTDQMHDPIAQLSSMIWGFYEKIDLVKKIKTS